MSVCVIWATVSLSFMHCVYACVMWFAMCFLVWGKFDPKSSHSLWTLFGDTQHTQCDLCLSDTLTNFKALSFATWTRQIKKNTCQQDLVQFKNSSTRHSLQHVDKPESAPVQHRFNTTWHQPPWTRIYCRSVLVLNFLQHCSTLQEQRRTPPFISLMERKHSSEL